MLHIYNFYDDWLINISNFTCFNRLALILRGIHVDFNKAFNFLKENGDIKN